jgi:hypothetical protein
MRRWENNIKIGLEKMGWGDVDYDYLAQGRDQ